MLLLVFSVFSAVLGAHLPPSVKLCHRSDPNFLQCVGKNMGAALRVFAAGDKALGIPRLEPFYLEQLEFISPPSQTIELHQKYRHVYTHGMTESNLTSFHMELDKGCEIVFDVISPAIRLEADYELRGKILVFPLNSHGKCNITQYNLNNRHTMTCQLYTKKNETFLKVTNYTMDMKPERIDYGFENIFPENQDISAEILRTLNENSLSIFNEVKSALEQAYSTIHMNEANRVFSQIPLKEMFLE